MIKIRSYSDIHWEFEAAGKSGFWEPVKLEDDENTILVHPGDLGFLTADLIARYARRFRKVILTFGNHDYWGSYLYDGKHCHGAVSVLNKRLAELGLDGHVIILDRSTYSIDGYLFVGATMWTSLNNNDEAARNAAKNKMNDFERIGVEQGFVTRRMTVEDWAIRHSLEYGYIKRKVENSPNEKIIVVSHHAPCGLSITSRHGRKPIHYCYFSEYGAWIAQHPQIKLWLHGHVHFFNDYFIGSTRVVCNPRGYVDVDKDTIQHTGFDDELIINLK